MLYPCTCVLVRLTHVILAFQLLPPQTSRVAETNVLLKIFTLVAANMDVKYTWFKAPSVSYNTPPVGQKAQVSPSPPENEDGLYPCSVI